MLCTANTGLHYVEGPTHYSSANVAAAFAAALNKPVEAIQMPRDQWIQALTSMGFSDKAAKSMANMTAATLDQKPMMPVDPERGTTTLKTYIRKLVDGSQKQ